MAEEVWLEKLILVTVIVVELFVMEMNENVQYTFFFELQSKLNNELFFLILSKKGT